MPIHDQRHDVQYRLQPMTWLAYLIFGASGLLFGILVVL